MQGSSSKTTCSIGGDPFCFRIGLELWIVLGSKNGASQQELTVMKEKEERMVTHLEEALAHFDSQELRN